MALVPSTSVGGSSSASVTELAYAQITANATISATTEAGADTIVTAAAVTLDGTTSVLVEFYCDLISCASVALSNASLYLFDSGTSLGRIWFSQKDNSASANAGDQGCYLGVKLVTPSAGSHTYSIRGARGVGNAVILAGAGGSGNERPAYIRVTQTT